MSEFLRQSGCSPWPYWLGAGVTLVLWLVSALLPADPAGPPLARRNSPVVFATLLLVTMLAWRWPAILHFRPVNPDEPQFLAGAITMLGRHEFWWVDATTSGPLVVLPLTLPGLFSQPVDYGNGRIVGLLLEWGTAVLAYLTLRRVHGERSARRLVAPLAGFFVVLLFWDFVPYCSELVPLFCCALAVWLGVTAFRVDGSVGDRRRLALGGVVLGLLPFTKFQVLPLGAAIGLSMIAWIVRQPEASRGKMSRDLLVLLAGVAGGFGAMAFSLWGSGGLADFYQSYWVHNLQYAQARAMAWAASGYTLHYLSGLSWGFALFHYGLLLLLAVSLVGIRRAAWRPLLLGWSLLLAAYGAVLVPGRLYPHYLLLLTLPLGLAAGLQFGGLIRDARATPRRQAVWWIFFLSVGLGAQVLERVADRQPLEKLAKVDLTRAPATGFINHVKRPGDALAVWGWRPELYVETQLPQATREAHADAQLQDTPQRGYFRARFLADLRENQPAFFVDSVGPADYGHTDSAKEGHESFPELGEYVRQEYTLVSKASPIRVYVRRALLDGSDTPARR